MFIPDASSGPRLGAILLDQHNVPGKYTLSEHLWSYLRNYADKHRLKGNGFGFGLFGPGDVARTLSARYHKDGAEILIRQHGKGPRRLTPRECARLMGFDAPGFDARDRPPMLIPVSDTQAYRQFGNSVVVPVVEAIARHMAPYILDVFRLNDCRSFDNPQAAVRQHMKSPAAPLDSLAGKPRAPHGEAQQIAQRNQRQLSFALRV